MSRKLLTAGVALALLVGSGCVFQAHRAASARLVALQAAQAAVNASESTLSDQNDALVSDRKQLISNIKWRISAAKEHESDVALSLAGKELDLSHACTKDVKDIGDTLTGMADTFASVYGEEAVSSLRADVSDSVSKNEESFSDWSTAAGLIQNSLQAHAYVGLDAIEGYYNSSDQSAIEARKSTEAAMRDLQDLSDRLNADVERYQHKVAFLF